MDGTGPLTLSTGQTLLACICLGGYSIALGRMTGPLGRVMAMLSSAVAAALLVRMSASWETGVLTVAFLPVGVAILAAATWAVWKLTGGRAGLVSGVMGRSSTLRRLASFQHVELAVDEYSMTWSDAIRAETDFLEKQPVPDPSDNFDQFGTLGRALWRERSLAWLLRLDPTARSEIERSADGR